MSVMDFYGKDFFENKLPEIIEELHRIGDAVSPKEVMETESRTVQTACVTDETITVYVCYEENSVALYNDAGNISSMYVTADIEAAKKWATLAFDEAKKNKYLSISDEERVEMLDSIGKENFSSTWVYKNKNEDAPENYGICVDRFTLGKDPEEAFK